MSSILDSIRCTPSRRPLRFTPGPLSYHSLVFDPSVSREERLLLFMELFAYYPLLVDPAVLPDFTVAPYLPEELLEIRVVTDPRHPACGQAGLYARRTIAANAVVTAYAGVVEIFGTSCNSRTYTMGFGSISDDYALDAEFCGNYGRFANDPRGVEGLTANLSAESRFNARGESFTALVARRQINEGEEILMAYGKAHSLAASPWVSVRGEQVTRRREGGIVPVPLFASPGCIEGERHEASSSSHSCGAFGSSSHGSTNVDGDYRKEDDLLADASPAEATLAYHILWECPQCGTWTPCRSPSMVALEMCHGCATPKLSGARMVALLSSPALPKSTDTDALDTVPSKPTVGIASTANSVVGSAVMPSSSTSPGGPAVNRLDVSMAALDATWYSRAPPNPLRPLSPLHPQQQQSMQPSASAVDRRNNAAAAASSSSRGIAAAWPQPYSSFCSTRSPTSPHSPFSYVTGMPASPDSGKGSGNNGGSGAGLATLHASTYASVHADWPMNVPFTPWQFWDAAVPLSAVTRHTRFEAHEHVLLYTVETTRVDGGEEGVAERDAPPSAEGTAMATPAGMLRSSSASSGSDADRDRKDQGRAAKSDSEEHEAVTIPRRAKRSRPAMTKANGPSAGGTSSTSERRGQRRREQKRQVLWERQSADGVSPVLFRGADGLPSLPPSPTPEAERHSAVNAVAQSSLKGSIGGGNCDDSHRVIPCAPIPTLTAALLTYREEERLVLLHTRRQPLTTPSGGGSTSCSVALVQSPRATAAAALCRMVRRPFAGKAFRPGDTVAFFGGVVRRLADVRARPEHSPLAIPLLYLCPTALRTLLSDSTAATAASGDARDTWSTATATEAARHGARDLLQRLRELCLVVTNELMYCPVLAPAAYDDPGAIGAHSGGDARWEEEARALTRACNVALALTLDNLGCPHVVAVATRHIASFEPLLARVQ